MRFWSGVAGRASAPQARLSSAIGSTDSPVPADHRLRFYDRNRIQNPREESTLPNATYQRPENGETARSPRSRQAACKYESPSRLPIDGCNNKSASSIYSRSTDEPAKGSSSPSFPAASLHANAKAPKQFTHRSKPPFVRVSNRCMMVP